MREIKGRPTAQPEPKRGYYERESHDTALECLIIAVFGGVGALTSGALVSLYLDGWPVLIAAAFGAIGGAMVYALCAVSARCSREEEGE